MILIKQSEDIPTVTQSDILALIKLRSRQLGPDFFGILVEPGDTVSSLEAASGCPILSNPFNDAVYGDEDFVPMSEWIEDHGCCYEMVFILSDADAGTALFIPKSSGLDPVLLSLCAEFCVQADSDL